MGPCTVIGQIRPGFAADFVAVAADPLDDLEAMRTISLVVQGGRAVRDARHGAAGPVPPGDWLERDSLVSCPDPEERLVMRITRTVRRKMSSSDLT
jgi:hypothetical protein